MDANCWKSIARGEPKQHTYIHPFAQTRAHKQWTAQENVVGPTSDRFSRAALGDTAVILITCLQFHAPSCRGTHFFVWILESNNRFLVVIAAHITIVVHSDYNFSSVLLLRCSSFLRNDPHILGNNTASVPYFTKLLLISAYSEL